jgi:hypothetical protein
MTPDFLHVGASVLLAVMSGVLAERRTKANASMET